MQWRSHTQHPPCNRGYSPFSIVRVFFENRKKISVISRFMELLDLQ